MKQLQVQKRYKRRFMVRYGERDLSHSGFTQDVSRGGAFIVSPYRPPLDSKLHLQIFVDKETSVYFEATVRRHKIVPPELRSVDKGGFGIRFLLPDELLGQVLVEPGARVEVRYTTPADLRLAQEREFRHGGVFVPGEHQFQRGSEVTLLMRLDFSSAALEFAASVVHVYDGSQARPRGIGLVFKDKKEVDDALALYLN